jgi:hypothetical protein
MGKQCTKNDMKAKIRTQILLQRKSKENSILTLFLEIWNQNTSELGIDIYDMWINEAS